MKSLFDYYVLRYHNYYMMMMMMMMMIDEYIYVYQITFTRLYSGTGVELVPTYCM